MMAYYTAVNREKDKYGKKVWKNGAFSVYKWQGRLTLFNGEYEVACLIEGEDALKKYHKGDYMVWIQNVKKKDLKKAEKIRRLAEEATLDANFIESLWE